MDFIPLNIVSGYRGSVAAGRNFWESKHQNNSHIPVSDAIVALYQDETARITSAFLITKRLDNFSITKHETLTPICGCPPFPFSIFLEKQRRRDITGNYRESGRGGVSITPTLFMLCQVRLGTASLTLPHTPQRFRYNNGI